MLSQLSEVGFNRRMLICIMIGFSSGMPLFVLFQLIPAWLRTEGVSLTDIGLFTLVGLPYTWKFLWSPLMDQLKLPLGLRRGWMLLMQLGCFMSIAWIGQYSPDESLQLIVVFAAIVAVFSASQDIAIDAYRRELLSEKEMGLGNSIHVAAYRASSLVPGSLALILADNLDWNQVFMITASFMLIGVLTSLIIREPAIDRPEGRNLKAAIVEPFREFFQRDGLKHALMILAFLVLYKLGDSMATALATPFYLDMSYSLTEIGLVAKHAALWPSIIGGILGGVIMVYIGINRALWLFGVVQITSILGYLILSQSEHNLVVLGAVVGFEYLGVGLGTAAFLAFMMTQTNIKFSATQFALFSALTAVPRTIANAASGFIIDDIGWSSFFIVCFVVAIPGMLMLLQVAPWNEKPGLTNLSPTDNSSG